MDLAGLHTPGFKDFCRRRNILLVVLFGSRGTGRAGAQSDVDLAIQLGEPEAPLAAGRARRQLLRDLVGHLRTEAIGSVNRNVAAGYPGQGPVNAAGVASRVNRRAWLLFVA